MTPCLVSSSPSLPFSRFPLPLFPLSSMLPYPPLLSLSRIVPSLPFCFRKTVGCVISNRNRWFRIELSDSLKYFKFNHIHWKEVERCSCHHFFTHSLRISQWTPLRAPRCQCLHRWNAFVQLQWFSLAILFLVVQSRPIHFFFSFSFSVLDLLLQVSSISTNLFVYFIRNIRAYLIIDGISSMHFEMGCIELASVCWYCNVNTFKILANRVKSRNGINNTYCQHFILQ